MRICAVLVALAVAAGCGFPTQSGTNEGTALLEQVAAALQSAESLRIEGESRSETTDADGNLLQHGSARFSMLLDRSGRYKIEWQETDSDGYEGRGAAWNTGDGPFVHRGPGSPAAPAADDRAAQGAAARRMGQLGIATLHFYFPADPPDRFLLPFPWEGYSMEGSESFDGTPSTILRRELEPEGELTLWIDTHRPFIRKARLEVIRLPIEGDVADEDESLPSVISFTLDQTVTRVDWNEPIADEEFMYHVAEGEVESVAPGVPVGSQSLESLLPGLGSKVNE